MVLINFWKKIMDVHGFDRFFEKIMYYSLWFRSIFWKKIMDYSSWFRLIVWKKSWTIVHGFD